MESRHAGVAAGWPTGIPGVPTSVHGMCKTLDQLQPRKLDDDDARMLGLQVPLRLCWSARAADRAVK